MRKAFLLALCLPLLGWSQNTLLFELTKPGIDHKSYLFGTIHVQDEKAFNFNDSVFWAIEQAEKAEFELDLNQGKIQRKLMSELEGAFDDEFENKFKNYITSDLAPAIMDKFDAGDLAKSLSKKMFPVVKKMVESRFGSDNRSQFVDLYLQNYARSLNKEIVGIEGYEEQVLALLGDVNEIKLERMTPFIMKFLESDNLNSSMLAYFTSTQDMIEGYSQHDLDKICATLISDDYSNNPFYKKFYDRIFIQRNDLMFERTKTDVASGSTFIAVGTGHLCGKNGLINQYKKAGYTLRPINIEKTSGKLTEWKSYNGGNYSVDIYEDAVIKEEYSSGKSYYFMPMIDMDDESLYYSQNGLLQFKVDINSKVDQDYNEAYEEVVEMVEAVPNPEYVVEEAVEESETAVEYNSADAAEEAVEEIESDAVVAPPVVIDDGAEIQEEEVVVYEIEETSSAADEKDRIEYNDTEIEYTVEEVEISEEELNSVPKREDKIELTDAQREWFEEFEDSIKVEFKRFSNLNKEKIANRYAKDTSEIMINGKECELVKHIGIMGNSLRVKYETEEITYYIELVGDPAVLKDERNLRFFTSFKPQ